MMPGQLVGRKKNRHANWSDVTWTDMPTDPVQQYPAFLLVGFDCNIHYCWCYVTNTHDCWPRVSLNGMCAGSVPHYWTRMMLRMSDMMSWWHYMVAVQWNFNIYACGLGTIQSNMPPGPLEIKEKSYLTDTPHQTCQLTLWNFINQDRYIANITYIPCRELLCHCSCNIYVCWPSVTVTNTAAVQKCLLVEFCCKMDAYWTVATQSACLLTFCHSILHVCWRCASLSAIPAVMVSHYQPCLLVWCLTISCACWYGISLSAVPAGMVSQYQLCLLEWYLTISCACCYGVSLSAVSAGVVLHIGHTFWFGTSLSAMPVGVVPYSLPCLLVHFAIQPTFWLVECRRKRDGYKSGATLTEVPLHQTCLLIWCHSQICLLV